jgi:hypothetical protein
MARITAAWGSVPTLMCSRKRVLPNNSWLNRILSITCWGLPTTSEPRGARIIS